MRRRKVENVSPLWLLALITLTDSAPADAGVELVEDAGVPVEAPAPLPPPMPAARGPGIRSPVFEVGATVLTSSTAELRAGPTFRCILYSGDFVASGSLDWSIGDGPGRALILAGAGLSRVMRPRVRIFGLGLAGVDAINGPPILVLPVLALRVGGDWLAAWLFLKSVGATMTIAYDVPYLWSGPGVPSRGFTFWLSVTAAFEVLR